MSPTRSESWRSRDVAAALAFLAVLALQVGVPLQRLAAMAAGERPPARFGWQMYSRAPERLEVAVVLEDGSRHVVGTSTLLVQPRAEVPVEELVPGLCQASPRARAVQVTPEDGPSRTVPCPP